MKKNTVRKSIVPEVIAINFIGFVDCFLLLVIFNLGDWILKIALILIVQGTEFILLVKLMKALRSKLQDRK